MYKESNFLLDLGINLSVFGGLDTLSAVSLYKWLLL